MITKLLRRFGFIGQDKIVKANAAFLRERQNQQLSLLEPLKDNVDRKILNATLQELRAMDSETVFNTFATRAIKPEIRSLNALADVNVQRVFEKQAHKRIPFSVKDHLKVEGMIHSCGFTDNLKPATESADVVKFLEEEGCIAFAHSNVPQGLLGIQSSNSLYGTSTNPHNPAFVSGGSSGGQGALVAAKVSAFGVGSDSGGSARIPAAFCGTYGFKPTGSKRISLKGRVNPRGSEGVKMGDVDPCFGFMTRHFDDLAWLCSKTLGKSTKSYPFMYGGQWDQSRFQAAKRKKLNVGYLYKNHEMKVAQGLINTVEETLDLLRGQRHQVVEFEFPKLHLFRDFFFEFVHQSGFLNGMIERMNGHLTAAQAADLYDIFTFGKLGVTVKRSLAQDPLIKDIYNLYIKDRTTEEFFRIHREADELKKLFLKEWNEKGIDVLITPVMPFTAPYPGVTSILVYQLSFCCFQNVIELPAGVVPTRLVKEEETKYTPTNAFEKLAAPSIQASKGMPLAIQVTGQHLKDEECLGAMWTINKLTGRYLQPTFNKCPQ